MHAVRNRLLARPEAHAGQDACRGTVRSTEPRRVAFLTRLGEALPGRLHLYEADLLQPGSFDAVCTGADVM